MIKVCKLKNFQAFVLISTFTETLLGSASTEMFETRASSIKLEFEQQD